MTSIKTVGLAFLIGTLSLTGCATQSGVITNPSVPKAHYTSIYLVTHGGNGGDMDANLQKEFLKHGLAVTSGGEGGGNADLIARYADNWRWDLAMYLRSLDLMLYDGKTNNLIATGSWKNSAFHGFYSSEKVVTNVVNDTLAKTNVP